MGRGRGDVPELGRCFGDLDDGARVAEIRLLVVGESGPGSLRRRGDGQVLLTIARRVGHDGGADGFVPDFGHGDGRVRANDDIVLDIPGTHRPRKVTVDSSSTVSIRLRLEQRHSSGRVFHGVNVHHEGRGAKFQLC